MKITAQQARLKKLRMRSWRRGMKEMDLILGPFADSSLTDLSVTALQDYEALLDENDQDLYLWVTGARPCPPHLLPMLEQIARASGLKPAASQSE